MRDRATLARRFPARVGCTPAADLARWRMDLAAVRLRHTDDTDGAIARSLGYTAGGRGGDRNGGPAPGSASPPGPIRCADAT